MGVTLLTSGILDDCLQSHNLFWDLPWGKKQMDMPWTWELQDMFLQPDKCLNADEYAVETKHKYIYIYLNPCHSQHMIKYAASGIKFKQPKTGRARQRKNVARFGWCAKKCTEYVCWEVCRTRQFQIYIEIPKLRLSFFQAIHVLRHYISWRIPAIDSYSYTWAQCMSWSLLEINESH